jgi:hypothetical protein
MDSNQIKHALNKKQYLNFELVKAGKMNKGGMATKKAKRK